MEQPFLTVIHVTSQHIEKSTQQLENVFVKKDIYQLILQLSFVYNVMLVVKHVFQPQITVVLLVIQGFIE